MGNLSEQKVLHEWNGGDGFRYAVVGDEIQRGENIMPGIWDVKRDRVHTPVAREMARLAAEVKALRKALTSLSPFDNADEALKAMEER